MMTERVLRVSSSIFPTPETEGENRVICVNGGYGRKDHLRVLMSKLLFLIL